MSANVASSALVIAMWKPVVDVRGAVGAALPVLERRAQAARLLLDHEVNDAGRSSRGGGARARVVIVDRARAAERHRHVRVVVDQPGEDVAAARVDHLGVDVPHRADGDDLLPVHQHVRHGRLAGVHNRAALDQLPHVAPPVTPAKRGMISRPYTSSVASCPSVMR
jgi:hypothetical protein